MNDYSCKTLHEITSSEEIEDILVGLFQYKNKKHSNTIYTFDIETTSLFYLNGEFKTFDYTLPYEFWTDNLIERRSCCYCCMFGIEDNVYMFRFLSLFKEILEKISDKKIKKYIYIHNASWEFQFLREIFEDYTITNMLANAKRKPISWTIKELNIEFRCSYKLTMLSLDLASKKYTNVKKAKGDLYYNLPRSPLTKLTQKEKYYCYMDIITLYEIIKFFKNEYKSIAKIPLTQTGEIRKAIKKAVNYFYIKKQQDLVTTPEIMVDLIQGFSGGLTHGNFIHTGNIIDCNLGYDYVYSADEDSAYPCQMLKKLPIGRWHEISKKEIKYFKDNHCLLYIVKIHNAKSKYFNHYMPISKCIRYKKAYVDNGRVVKVGYCEMILTDIDYELINKSYDIEKIDIISVYASRKGYLDKSIIEFILNLWQVKTSLKGISDDDERYNYYMKMKQQLNGIFGVSITSILKQDTIWDNENDEWSDIDTSTPEKLYEFVSMKLDEAKKSYSTLFPYAVGVWVCAMNRKALWDNIIAHDKYVVYYDTDSIKSIGQIDFTEHNKRVDEELKEMCKYYNIDEQKLYGKDINGNYHHIGYFDQETKNTAKEFCTLGAKKYCYRTLDGKLHLTVSGVKKSMVSQLDDDIKNFKDGMIFGYEQTNEYKNNEHEGEKLTHYYIDNQEPFTFTDIDGNEYTCNQKYGIVLQPTTYTLGYTDLLIASEEEYIEKSTRRLSDDFRNL